MAQLKPGSRMRSSVCATEVMVIATPSAELDLRCGGASMIPVGDEPAAGESLSPDANKGTAIGKRYVHEAGALDLLCTKPGEGSLGVESSLLVVKEAKPLPSSD